MSAETVGLLNGHSAVRRLVLDELTVTYVFDGTMSLSTEIFFPAIPASHWQAHPDALNDTGRVSMTTGGLLVQGGAETVLIDTGWGELKADQPVGLINSGDLLLTLDRLGVARKDVDVVAITHLHGDHTGWLFEPDADGVMKPVFPNARYVLSALEWAGVADGQQMRGVPAYESVIAPLAAAKTLVADGDAVTDGIRAVVTPGHSPGHTTFVISSASGRRVVAFGDAFHTPGQLAHPEWTSAPDTQVDEVAPARARVLEELLAPDTVGFAVHFGDQPFGKVTVTDGVPGWEPVPTEAIYPPSRLT